MNENLYPPSVQGAPPNFTVPNSAYKKQVVIVLISLAIFILFYLGLIAGSGWLVVYFVMKGMNDPTESLNTDETYRHHSSDTGWYYTFAVMAAVLFLFLVKALLKWGKRDEELRIEITEKWHPELFRFVRRICEDTKAPFPLKIFVTPEVNAAVFYNSSLLSLIFPVKKNLLIGLGLVNGLNLSEFKAVLAHEFGHFSQSSMRLGSYVYIANRVIYDLVYQRDKLDDLLEKAKRFNIRIAIFAYGIYAVLWILRMILQGAFKAINFFQSALSRQMEFHADLVAVSVTGSDSLIHALKKLEFLNACLSMSLVDLEQAADHQVYTEDIFYHQTMAAANVRRLLKEPDAGLIPPLPANPKQKAFLFKKEDTPGVSLMWASHPSDYDREQNAKKVYLRSEEDNRSAWILFSNPDDLRRRMTEAFYKYHEKNKKIFPMPVEQVQKFIDDEHSETLQDERYLGIYDGRLLSISSAELPSIANDPAVFTMTPDQIQLVLRKLYNAEYKDWMDSFTKRRDELGALESLESGATKMKGKQFTFRGEERKKAELKPLIEMLEFELKTDSEWLKEFDREVFCTHLKMAQIITGFDQEYYQRYEFHLKLQEILKSAKMQEQVLYGMYRFIAEKSGGLSKEEFKQVSATLAQCHGEMLAAMEKSRSVYLPALQNMQTGQPLNEFLLPERLVLLMANQDKIDGEWFSSFGRQISQIEERASRLYFKSIGAILNLQENISAKYSALVGVP